MQNPFEVFANDLKEIKTLIQDLNIPMNNVNAKTDTERPLNVHEAAQFLNLKVATIYSKVSKGELPVMKRSKRLYFSSAELMSYLKEGRVKSNIEIEAESESCFVNIKKGLK